jgi:hypothetical protein
MTWSVDVEHRCPMMQKDRTSVVRSYSAPESEVLRLISVAIISEPLILVITHDHNSWHA